MKIKDIITESTELNEFVTSADLERIENKLNALWDEDDVEINLHRKGREAGGESHFLQRANDPRNRPPIEPEEIENIFMTAHDFKTPRNKLKHMPPGKEAVLTDPETKINIPVVAKTNRHDDDTKIIPKTIMRKNNFLSNAEKISLPFANQRKVIKKPEEPITPEPDQEPEEIDDIDQVGDIDNSKDTELLNRIDKLAKPQS